MDMARNRNSTQTITGGKTLALLAIGLFSGLVNSCSFPKTKFGPEFNDHRKKIGLELLPRDWEAGSVSDDYTVWLNPDRGRLKDAKRPAFFSKATSYTKTGEIISEEDLYYSGKAFNTIDGHNDESLSIAYYFVSKEIAEVPVIGWHCTYTGQGKEVDPAVKKPEKIFYLKMADISLVQADSILKEWGMTIPQRIKK
jgi:hypothetical protein